MKFVDEFRRADLADMLIGGIRRAVTRPWTIMEVCGGQTHAILRFGLDRLLPPEVSLLHGPGCPVCVTPAEAIDRAIQIAAEPNAILCSFGDMLRVPGSGDDLNAARARGGDVRMVYSPLDALQIARSNPEREVVLFAVGFETTAPTTAMAVLLAEREGLRNFSLLVSHVLVPPAMEAILDTPECAIRGFLAAGHVCTVTGYDGYRALARRYRVPIVVTGFEPLDILQGILMCVRQLEAGRAEVENQYTRSARPAGNSAAQEAVARVFEVTAMNWRGVGEIPASGLRMNARYARFDVEHRFPGLPGFRAQYESECEAGRVLQGRIAPVQCPAFGTRCTPEHPLGAPMVSSEGACAAYYRYRPAATAGARQ